MSDVGGGTTTKEQIDIVQEYSNAKSLIILGLNQESFEYLIQNYGNQFKAISFWKNKRINDLSPYAIIEYFSLGNKVWAKMDIESLKPLIQSNVSHFAWLKNIE